MPERSLGEWLRYLEQLHPVEIDLGLSRVRVAAQRLDLLPFPTRVMTVAGTNGKGSVVYSAEAIMRACGLRTGRYTSPHLLSFNERIAVDGQSADDALILAAFNAIEAARGDVTLTYFEFATLAALWVFRKESVDIAILEVGLGGRLDAVNVVDADLAVITAIDLDHQHWLGDTVDAIAPEKAAVARAGRPVILAEQSYPSTLYKTLSDISAVPMPAGDHWSWRDNSDQQRVDQKSTDPKSDGPKSSDDFAVRVVGQRGFTAYPLPPGLRPANVAAAVQACAVMLGDGFDSDAAAAALRALQVPARRQVLNVAGRVLVLDVAHNPAAMAALSDYLRSHPVPGKTIAALGLMADKDLESMASLLAPAVDGACALAIPGIARAQTPEHIWQVLDDAGIAIAQAEFSTETVWQQLLDGSSAGDRLVVCGSFHTVAGIMAHLNIDLPGIPARASQIDG